jgi:hypothetical protein
MLYQVYTRLHMNRFRWRLYASHNPEGVQASRQVSNWMSLTPIERGKRALPPADA